MTSPKTLWPVARRWSGDDDAHEEKADRGREKAVAAKRVQQERLYVKQPQGRGEKHGDGEGKELVGARVVERGESRQGESGEVTGHAECRHRDSGHFRVSAAEHFEASRLSAASRRLASERQHCQIGRIRQPKNAEQCRDAVKNFAATRGRIVLVAFAHDFGYSFLSRAASIALCNPAGLI